MIPHKIGLPKAQLFSWGSLIPPKVHFGGSEGNEMSKLSHVFIAFSSFICEITVKQLYFGKEQIED